MLRFRKKLDQQLFSFLFLSAVATISFVLHRPRQGSEEAKVEDDADDDEEEGPPCAEEDDDGKMGAADEENLLSTFQHRFEKDLRQPTRNLLVKDVMICFDPSTTYGRRAGSFKALMVTVARHFAGFLIRFQTHNEAKTGIAGGNAFWKSDLWKRGLVLDVSMLPRAEMWKPPSSKMSMQSGFTDVQVRKQVAGLDKDHFLRSCHCML